VQAAEDPRRVDQRHELCQLDRLLGEQRHRARRVVLEHEARRVRRRAARLPERALVDEHDVGASELGEVVGDAGACHAAADDEDAGGSGRAARGVGSSHGV
jgi:hypothetical protein